MTTRREVLKGSIASAAAISTAGLATNVLAECAPLEWVPCDGRLLGRSIYPDLFNAIGFSYGKSDDEMFFRVPFLNGDVSTKASGSMVGIVYHNLLIDMYDGDPTSGMTQGGMS